MHDDIDITKYALIADDPMMAHRVMTAKARRRREQFAIAPLAWKDRLGPANALSAIVIDLLHRNWKQDGKPFPLPNGALAEIGVERRQKARALHKLEELGLITVEWRARKSPLVTVHLEPLPAGTKTD
jgi:hypothetical protein